MKYHTITQQSEADWSPWTTPAVKYRLACCDCGLIHDMQFMVLLKGGQKLDRRKGQIKFRVRRNKRATAAMRRRTSGK
jgi:hypothetical protein